MSFVTGVIVDFRGYACALVPNYTDFQRRMNEYQARANKEGVLYWHRHFLPRHFTPDNRRYRMQERKPPYKAIKRRLAEHGVVYIHGQRIRERVQRGGVVNVVRSGRTENMAKASTPVAAFPTRAVIRLRVNEAVARRPGQGKPDMAGEILMTPQDERDMIRVVIGVRFREEILRDMSFFTKQITRDELPPLPR